MSVLEPALPQINPLPPPPILEEVDVLLDPLPVDHEPEIQRTPLAVARFLRDQTKENFKEIVRLCRAGCHGLFLPVSPGEQVGEATTDFIEMWLVKKIEPLRDLDPAEIDTWERSGLGDYWSYQCRLALVQKIDRHRSVAEISLDEDDETPLLDLWADDGSGSSSWIGKIRETKLEPQDLEDYIDENLEALQGLGKMGRVLIAALKAFPANNITCSIARELKVSERQARRYMEQIPGVLQQEIARGNPVIRGLFNLLRNGTDTLSEHRRPWDSGPYMAFSPSTPVQDGDME